MAAAYGSIKQRKILRNKQMVWLLENFTEPNYMPDCTNNMASLSDTFQTNDVVDVIGPKEVALMGGQIAFWVKTKGKEGKAKIKISNDKLGTKEIILDVKKI